MRRILTAAVAACALAVAFAGGPAAAKTFRWAYQGDAQTLDPHALNESFTLGLLGNVYEGLIGRGPNLEIVPALAERWEILDPTRWRFHLRRGVKFHNGNVFNADDVIFSYRRTLAQGSDLKTRLATVKTVTKVDDYTVDFVTEVPNPALKAEWATWYIMDKEWSEEHAVVLPTDLTKGIQTYADDHANGTGPFTISARERNVRTVLTANPNWWNAANRRHNLTEAVFTPIPSASRRVTALLAGEIDWVEPIPAQDIKRIEADPNLEVVVGPELRTVFLGMDQFRDELLYSSVKGKNPFKDKRVREAFYRAIDIEAIRTKIMRGMATPSATLLSPLLFPTHASEFRRLAHDPEMARKLLADAGYKDGFSVGMDCPTDRYINDEAVCQAVVAMLAKVGIKVDLAVHPRGEYFRKILRPSLDTSFYLLGWTPASHDGWNLMFNVLGTPDDKTGRGRFNVAGWSNAEFDTLTDKVLVETNGKVRDGLMRDAFRILEQDVGYIPLHQQTIAWAKRKSVKVVQRADNVLMLSHVTVE